MFSLQNLCFMSFFALFILGGCTPANLQHEPTPKNIRILVVDLYTFDPRFHTLIEINEEKELEITVFTNNPYFATDVPFDLNIINDFIVMGGYDVELGIKRGYAGYDSPHTVLQSSKRELSQRQLNNIWRLAENVIVDGVSAEDMFHNFDSVIRCWGGYLVVWAIIDDELHFSTYRSDVENFMQHPDSPFVLHCEELLFLAYYLFDLSPILNGDFPIQPDSEFDIHDYVTSMLN